MTVLPTNDIEGKPSNADGQAVKPDFKAEVARLAEMDELEYDHISKAEAKRLGVTVAALTRAVKTHRKAKEAAEKPKSRAHLRVATSNDSPSSRRGMFTPVQVAYWPSMGEENPHANDVRNVKAVLDAAGVRLRYDVFTCKAVATFQGKSTVIDDGVIKRFWTMIQNSDLRAAKPFVDDAIMALALEATFDSAVDLFASVPKWDGVTRAETLLIDELGAEDTPYTRGATRLFWATLVRRGDGREFKCDEHIILRGPQRLGKSSLFKYLIGEEFFQENLKIGNKTRDVLELTLGKLVVEIAELAGIKKAEREDAKNFLSRTHDEFSLKHEKHTTRRGRRFAFVGTVNDETPIPNMLKEDRRFIIIPVSKRADLNRIKRDRLQILAEAVEIEKAYGPILELHDELRPQACEARSQVIAKPEYEDTLAETFGDIVSAKITASDVYAFLGLRDRTAIGKYTRSTGGGINPIMERLGWKYAQPRKDGVQKWSFVKGDGAGWLRPTWPHGSQAPAEIEQEGTGWTLQYEEDQPATAPNETLDDDGGSDF